MVIFKNAICIFPQDETTNFLQPIYVSLLEQGCKGFIVDSKEIGREQIIEAIKGAEIVFFLGHGTSFCLYGINSIPLIDKDNVEYLRGKRLFLLACRSAEFAKNNSLSNYIGFGDIPTSMDDVMSERDMDCEKYPNIDKDDVEIFCVSIVQIMQKSLMHCEIDDFKCLASMIKLFTNRTRRDVVSKNTKNNYEIQKMLYEFKHFMVFRKEYNIIN